MRDLRNFQQRRIPLSFDLVLQYNYIIDIAINWINHCPVNNYPEFSDGPSDNQANKKKMVLLKLIHCIYPVDALSTF